MRLQERKRNEDLSFSAPVSISIEDFQKIRAFLLDAIASVARIVEGSAPAKQVAYFGLDWLGVVPSNAGEP